MAKKISSKTKMFSDSNLYVLGNNVHSLSSSYSSISKLFLEFNPNLLKVSCTQTQAPTCSSKSISHHPNSTQFKYS